jgi:Uma2 family endonuclease
VATTSRRVSKPWTAEELDRLPAGWRYEIDDGELVIMAPAGFEHGDVMMAAGSLLRTHVESHRLGKVVGGEIGLRLRARPREAVRAADVAYFSNERAARIRDRRRISDVPPDLALEVHDPSEPDLQRKIEDYLTSGVRSVWVLDPVARTLTQHRPGQNPTVTGDPDATVADDVLPDFTCRLRELFGDR